MPVEEKVEEYDEDIDVHSVLVVIPFLFIKVISEGKDYSDNRGGASEYGSND